MGANGLGGDSHENKQLLVQMMCGQIRGSTCPMQFGDGAKSRREFCRTFRQNSSWKTWNSWVVAFFLTCSFGLVERTTNNSTRGVHRIHTRGVHD